MFKFIKKLGLSKRIANTKIFFTRSMSYLSIINFLLLISTFKKTYDLNLPIYMIIPLGIILSLTIGILDYIFVYKHEILFINKKNDIKSQLNDIEEKIDKLNIVKKSYNN